MRTPCARRARWLWLMSLLGGGLLAGDLSAGPRTGLRAGDADAVQASRHSRIEWRRDIGYHKAPLPHLGGTWLERPEERGRTRVWISATTLASRPTPAEVRREWQAGLDALQTARPGTRIHGGACAPHEVGISCQSESDDGKGREFLAQRMWFRAGVEKVLIQVRSSVSREHAATRLAEFALVPVQKNARVSGRGAR